MSTSLRLLLMTTTLVACSAKHSEPPELAIDNPDILEYSNSPTDEASKDIVYTEDLEPEPVPEAMPEPDPAPVEFAEAEEVSADDSTSMSASSGPSTGNGLVASPSGTRQARRAPRPESAPSAAPPPPSQSAPGYASTPVPVDNVHRDQIGGTEEYTDHGVNGFTITDQDALSTFSIDVDTASYTVARRKLQDSALPPMASVRVEEFVNYFDYEYTPPPYDAATPFQVHFDAFPDPFRDGRHIMRVGVQATEIPATERPPLHLTFLVDVSGSMGSADKLPLAQQALHMLVDTLQEGDTVALATYAGRTAEVLAPMDVSDKRAIHEAITALESGGSTAMSSGLDLAYNLALRSFEEGAENRVIVLSDGDANIGSTGWEDMLAQIKDKADMGITISTVGLGMGNYRDTLMEQLSNNGDGNNYYIDSLQQAQRVFIEDMAGTIFTVARDVKIQVEFHEDSVSAYRLIGYENRDIADRDFRNDRVDAGEIGSGHNVTALYEVILKEGYTDTLATVRLRYEAPGADKAAEEVAYPFPDNALHETVRQAGQNTRIAYAAATFAEILRDSPHTAEMQLDDVIRFAQAAKRSGERDDRELIGLMETARDLGAGAGPGVAGR